MTHLFDSARRLRLASLLPLLWFCASPSPAALSSGEGWRQLDTENFTLLSNLDPAATREVGLDLERLRSALTELFPRASFDSPKPTLMYVFADQASFAPFSLGGGEPGFFAPHAHANFAAVVGSSAGEALPVVYRQYMHDLIDHNVPQLPLWLRLGLAELMSTFEADAGVARIGLSGSEDMGLTGSTAISVAQLLEADSLPPGGEAQAAFLDLSRGLVHYLIVEDSDRFVAAANLVGELKEDPTSELTIAEALGVEIAKLDTDLAEYLARSPLPHREIQIPPAPAEPSLTALRPELALLHLGDLLIHTQPTRRGEAEELFRTAAEASPGLPAAVAGLGYSKELAGDLEGARELYLEALKELPDGFRLQFYYADCELQILGKRRPTNAEEEAALERSIAAFRKTTELRPTYGEGWARLGYAHNLQSRPSPDALPALERAYEMLPGRSDVAYNLMLGYARAGERNKAAELVEKMEARGTDAENLGRSKQILYQLDFQHAGLLAREKRFDDAVALYARVQGAAADPALRQRAAENMAKVAPGATSNRFAERLLEAYALWQANDATGARQMLETLAAEAAPGLQQEMVADLMEEL
jgi:tetratricopeptide (TPR) repeat protein